MNSNVRTIVVQESALASRKTGGRLRSVVEGAFATAFVCVDFSKVESVSESFADEFVGVLVQAYSLPWVFERLSLSGVRPSVAKTFAAAIRYRLGADDEARSDAIKSQARQAVQRRQVALANA